MPWQQRIEDQFQDGDYVIVEAFHPEGFFEWGGIPPGIHLSGRIYVNNDIKGVILKGRWIPLKYIAELYKV